jgi:hypothetical protein
LIGFTETAKRKIVEPLTPPLLPLSPPPQPFVPHPEDIEVPLLSDDSDSTAAEAVKLEAELMKNDAIKPMREKSAVSEDSMLLDDSDLGAIYSPSRGLSEKPSTPKRKRKAELKVESPLMSQFETPTKRLKTVSLAEVLDEIIPERPNSGDLDVLMDSDELERLMDEHIAPLAKQAEQRLNHEQLQEVDTIFRVDVPLVDQYKPIAPWEEFKQDMQHLLLTRMKLEDLRNDLNWQGVSQIEKHLQWMPFPDKLGYSDLQETIEHNEASTEVLDDVPQNEIVKSADVTWKPEGFRILDESEDSDEELEVFDFDMHKKETIEAIAQSKRDALQAQLSSKAREPSKHIMQSTLTQ